MPALLPNLLWLLCGLAAAVLAAIRVQLALLGQHPEWGWLALAAGLLAGGLTLSLVLVVALRWRSIRGAGLLSTAVLLAVVSAGSAGMLSFPVQNFKSPELRGEWQHLHPTLRLALWVARLGERDLVLTDLSRRPADYSTMSLALPATSAHYAAGDGYARAVDVRVSDAGELRNWARQGVFLLMGLNASRHAGTADHLHISLPTHPPGG